MIYITEGDTVISGSRKSEEFYIGGEDETVQNVTLITGGGNNWVNDFASENALIKTGKGDNTVHVDDGAINSTIETGAGEALIMIWTENLTTIKLGAGETTIDICEDAGVANLILDVSENDDYELDCSDASANVMLTDGEDNYTIRGTTDANVFNYAIPGSNLVIMAYGGEDLISVEEPLGKARVRGDDVYIPVEGGGSITVKNGKAHTLNINGQETIIGGYASGLTPQDVIKNFMYALTQTELQGIDAVDEAIRKSSPFKDTKKVIKRMVNECRLAKNGDEFLRKHCNIIFDNADTGAISGWDAGTSDVKTADSIVEEHGRLKIFRGKSFKVNGLKVIVPDNPTATQQSIINGLYTWWIKGALDLIEDSYGSAFRFDNPNASANEITVIFTRESDCLASFAYVSEDDGRSTEFDLQISMNHYKKLNGLDENGSVKNSDKLFLDRTLAHEFTHAVMAANIKYFGKLPAFIKEGTAELTHGIKDDDRDDIEALADDWEKLEAVLTNFTNHADDIDVEDVSYPAYAGGYMFLQYFAKKVANMSPD